jgi:ubiquinone/menaquinone biosynthesis C-methylase UbiE
MTDSPEKGRNNTKWGAKMLAENVEGNSILEVASGPGYLAIELAKRGR